MKASDVRIVSDAARQVIEAAQVSEVEVLKGQVDTAYAEGQEAAEAVLGLKVYPEIAVAAQAGEYRVYVSYGSCPVDTADAALTVVLACVRGIADELQRMLNEDGFKVRPLSHIDDRTVYYDLEISW